MQDTNHTFRIVSILLIGMVYQATCLAQSETPDRVVAQGNSLYNETVEVDVEKFRHGYRLHDPVRGIVVLDMQSRTDFSTAVDFVSATPEFNTKNQAAAVSVLWAAQATYDYYQERFGIEGFDGRNGTITYYVHFGRSFFNAVSNRNKIHFGDGGAHNSGAIVSLDYVGHETTHSFIIGHSNLGYEGTAAVLNESFCDIFAKSIEHWKTPGRATWEMFPDIYLDEGRSTRSMVRPKTAYLQQCADTFRGENWSRGKGVYVRGGVQNHWFYLLVQGGQGTNDHGTKYTVTGIGFEKAEQIAFRNLTVYLKPNSEFVDARFGAIQSAIDLFGKDSAEVVATKAAWDAVGVTNESPSRHVRAITQIVVTRNASGMLKKPVSAAADDFPGSHNRSGQQTNSMQWLLHSSSKVQSCAQFLGWQNWEACAGKHFEIRFTDSGSKAFFRQQTDAGSLEDVPFELWCLQGTPNDSTDDVRMIPVVTDIDKNNSFGIIDADAIGWGYTLDHPTSPNDDDCWTDMITWVMPENAEPGDAGYRQFEESDRKKVTGTEVLRWTTLVAIDSVDFTQQGWRKTLKAQLPEPGTIIRLSTSKETEKSKPPEPQPVKNKHIKAIVKKLKQ